MFLEELRFEKQTFLPGLNFSRPRNLFNLILAPALPLSSSMTSTKSCNLPKPRGRPRQTLCHSISGLLLMSKQGPGRSLFLGSHPQGLNVPSLRSCHHLLCPLGCLFPNNNCNNNNSQPLCNSDTEMTAPEPTWSAYSWPIMGSVQGAYMPSLRHVCSLNTNTLGNEVKHFPQTQKSFQVNSSPITRTRSQQAVKTRN